MADVARSDQAKQEAKMTRAWQPTPRESRARHPEVAGFAVRGDGTRIFYEVYGEGERTIVFVPPWAVVHSRLWKAQIPYFARRARVIAFDPRGNGRSDRPADPSLHSEDENAADIGAVLDAVGCERAVLVTMSRGCQRTLLFAAEHPERVEAAVLIASATLLSPERQVSNELNTGALTGRGVAAEQLPGIFWFNREAWENDPSHYRSFLGWFFESFFEPHSTKQIEDGIAWGLETSGATLAATHLGPQIDAARTRELCSRVKCPTLVIHGTADRITPFAEGEALAAALGTRLERVEGSGHGPMVRKPVQVNHAIRAFLEPGFEREPAPRRLGRRRTKRVLYVSSPIGLGHAQRDVAIARALRSRVDGIEIDWLAQHPVTRVLDGEGERIHPASRHLASESQHIECESAEHDLHCFQAIRRMDEILINNFMVFDDVMREGDYDLIVGDEAWEIDYYLHENPRQKRAPYVWLTDFVGWIPMPDGGEHEAFLTADYNQEMIAHIAHHPEVRDRAIFVGNREDIVARRFGPELPWIREWTEANYSFAGYVTGFDPASLGRREGLRDELGYRPDEKVCIVSVGGSGVGAHLLRRVIAAYPEARRREPALRMIVVAGPRIDPASLPSHQGLEVVAYVHNLYRHLAACDLAVVQGGLTTTMELTASARPFLYFPLRHHFEQNVHVRHRLANYRAGRCMDFDAETPETIAAAIASEIGRRVDSLPVETDGAERAARLIAELL
jgi:pimeloyl-ACP methyl ester carboxylesterase/predicted glycosyltransferase